MESTKNKVDFQVSQVAEADLVQYESISDIAMDSQNLDVGREASSDDIEINGLDEELIDHFIDEDEVDCDTGGGSKRQFAGAYSENVNVANETPGSDITAVHPPACKCTACYQRHAKKKKACHCQYCSVTFTKRSNLRRHLRHVHKISATKQSVTVASDSNEISVRAKKTVSCPMCNKLFFNVTDMENHMRCKHQSPAYLCTQCKAMFVRLDKAQAHILTHSKDLLLPLMCIVHDGNLIDAGNSELKAKNNSESNVAGNSSVIRPLMSESWSMSTANQAATSVVSTNQIAAVGGSIKQRMGVKFKRTSEGKLAMSQGKQKAEESSTPSAASRRRNKRKKRPAARAAANSKPNVAAQTNPEANSGAQCMLKEETDYKQGTGDGALVEERNSNWNDGQLSRSAQLVPERGERRQQMELDQRRNQRLSGGRSPGSGSPGPWMDSQPNDDPPWDSPPHPWMDGSSRVPGPWMGGPRTSGLWMDGSRPPGPWMNGPRSPGPWMDDPRPPGPWMDRPRPPGPWMDRPRPPGSWMDGPGWGGPWQRPPGPWMRGPRPPWSYDGFQRLVRPRPPTDLTSNSQKKQTILNLESFSRDKEKEKSSEPLKEDGECEEVDEFSSWVAAPKVWHFKIGKLHDEIVPRVVHKHLTARGIQPITIEELPTLPNATKSIHIAVLVADKEKVMEESFWPAGIRISGWRMLGKERSANNNPLDCSATFNNEFDNSSQFSSRQFNSTNSIYGSISNNRYDLQHSISDYDVSSGCHGDYDYRNMRDSRSYHDDYNRHEGRSSYDWHRDQHDDYNERRLHGDSRDRSRSRHSDGYELHRRNRSRSSERTDTSCSSVSCSHVTEKLHHSNANCRNTPSDVNRSSVLDNWSELSYDQRLAIQMQRVGQSRDVTQQLKQQSSSLGIPSTVVSVLPSPFQQQPAQQHNNSSCYEQPSSSIGTNTSVHSSSVNYAQPKALQQQTQQQSNVSNSSKFAVVSADTYWSAFSQAYNSNAQQAYNDESDTLGWVQDLYVDYDQPDENTTAW